MLEIIHHVLPEAFFDVLKTVPLLLVVYALLYYIENRLTNTPELLSRAAQFGPVVGALAGSIPQCGFSAAASALFSAGFLAPATLVDVYKRQLRSRRRRAGDTAAGLRRSPHSSRTRRHRARRHRARRPITAVIIPAEYPIITVKRCV